MKQMADDDMSLYRRRLTRNWSRTFDYNVERK